MWCMSSRLKSVTELFWLHWDFFFCGWFFMFFFFVQVFCINYYGSNYLMCCLNLYFFRCKFVRGDFEIKSGKKKGKTMRLMSIFRFECFEIYWWFFFLCFRVWLFLRVDVKVKVGHMNESCISKPHTFHLDGI